MRIDYEYQALIPPLSDDEFRTLETSILAEGIREPIVAWDDVIIDGHNRYAIAQKHGVEYTVKRVQFESKEDAKIWMIDNQRGRRNLSKQAWLELGFKRAELLKPKAKANMSVRKGNQPGASFQESEKLEPVNTVKEAADYAGVSIDTAAKFNTVIREAEEPVREAMRSGEISINKAYEQTKRPHVSNNSGENEWYTPVQYIESARAVMGRIDTDPASSELANKTVRATTYYTKDDDGLEQTWSGNVWMNPPYAQPLMTQFAEAVTSKYKEREINQAIVLVNNATETAWFQTMLTECSAVCFPKGRIRFIDMNGNPSGAPLQGQAILYFGDKPEVFTQYFDDYGTVLYV